MDDEEDQRVDGFRWHCTTHHYDAVRCLWVLHLIGGKRVTCISGGGTKEKTRDTRLRNAPFLQL